MKYTKAELTEFTKTLIRANNALWDAICECEELTKSEIYKDLTESHDDEVEQFLQIVAAKFLKSSKFSSFASPDFDESYFQDFGRLCEKLMDYVQ